MRLRLEAHPEELERKGGALVERLACALETSHPELAERLHKALDPPLPEHLDYPAVEQLRQDFVASYVKQMDAMVRDIGRVLEHAGTQMDKSQEPS